MANEHARKLAEARRALGISEAGQTRESRQGQQATARADAIRAALRDRPRHVQEDEDAEIERLERGLIEPLELPQPSKLKLAWIAWRATRKWKKGKVTMPDYVKPVSAPILQSKTTRDVATGAAVAGGTAYGLLAAARAILGDAAMPWDPAADAAIAVAATAILTPLLARLKALFRRGSP